MTINSQWTGALVVLCITTFGLSSADAQLLNRIERRAVRNERQLQRQVNRSNYYTDQTWQTLTPWAQRYNVAPLQRAANAVAATANAVGNTVARTAEAVDGDGVRYGYRSNVPANRWFYDYYTYRPTYYYGAQDSGRYTSAIRYFDSDNDGVYDSQAVYRDSNQDGRYDEYDRMDFYAPSAAADVATSSSLDVTQSEPMDAPLHDARRYRLEGEVAVTKSASVNGAEHLLVGLRQEDQKDVQAVDLGPVEDMRDQGIEVGKLLVAEGTVEDVGDQQVLIADRVRVDNDQTIEIDQNAEKRIEGRVVDVQKVQVGSVETLMAIMDANGERLLVDLGPAASFPAMPDSNMPITLTGVPIQSQGHQVLLASRVWLSDKPYRIQRLRDR